MLIHISSILVNVDSTEDHEIHYLKDGGVAINARPAISEVTCRLMDESSSDRETDLFTSSNEEEGELEENKIVLEDDSLDYFWLFLSLLLNYLSCCSHTWQSTCTVL